MRVNRAYTDPLPVGIHQSKQAIGSRSVRMCSDVKQCPGHTYYVLHGEDKYMQLLGSCTCGLCESRTILRRSNKHSCEQTDAHWGSTYIFMYKYTYSFNSVLWMFFILYRRILLVHISKHVTRLWSHSTVLEIIYVFEIGPTSSLHKNYKMNQTVL